MWCGDRTAHCAIETEKWTGPFGLPSLRGNAASNEVKLGPSGTCPENGFTVVLDTLMNKEG